MLALLTAIYRYWFWQEKRISNLRHRIAADLHDEISNTFNNISYLAKENQTEALAKTKEQLEIIQTMSADAIQNVQDVIWALSDNYKTIKNLRFRMEDYADNVLKNKGFPVKFDYKNLDDDQPLNFQRCRHILLIFKEAISNIIKHTEPEKVEILIYKTEQSFFNLQITNHFKKEKEVTSSTGRGIQNMKKRAKEIGGTLSIEKTKNCFQISLTL